MRSIMKRTITAAAVAAVAVLALGCSSELSDNAAPVQLVVTNAQNMNQIDLAGGSGCDQAIGTVQMRAIAKNATASGPFVDVRILRYRVSYIRTDGGKTVPAPFVRSIDTVLTVGGTPAGLSNFLAFEPGALTQAPFVALWPNNGGRDPETGSRIVKMDIVLEVFGQTLAGDDVYGTTRMPLDFCFSCGGCA